MKYTFIKSLTIVIILFLMITSCQEGSTNKNEVITNQNEEITNNGIDTAALIPKLNITNSIKLNEIIVGDNSNRHLHNSFLISYKDRTCVQTIIDTFKFGDLLKIYLTPAQPGFYKIKHTITKNKNSKKNYIASLFNSDTCGLRFGIVNKGELYGIIGDVDVRDGMQTGPGSKFNNKTDTFYYYMLEEKSANEVLGYDLNSVNKLTPLTIDTLCVK